MERRRYFKKINEEYVPDISGKFMEIYFDQLKPWLEKPFLIEYENIYSKKRSRAFTPAISTYENNYGTSTQCVFFQLLFHGQISKKYRAQNWQFWFSLRFCL